MMELGLGLVLRNLALKIGLFRGKCSLTKIVDVLVYVI